MTPVEYAIYSYGYILRESREWERVRKICYHIVNGYADKPVPEEKVFGLFTDRFRPELKELSQKEIAKRIKELTPK